MEDINETKKKPGFTCKDGKPGNKDSQIKYEKTVIKTKITCAKSADVYLNEQNHLRECQNLAMLFRVPLEYVINNYDSLSELSKSCGL